MDVQVKAMKRKIIVPRWVKILIVSVSIWLIIFATDLVRVKTKHGPIFCIPVAVYKDGGSVDYIGIFYKVKKQVVNFELAVSGEVAGFKYSISSWLKSFDEL